MLPSILDKEVEQYLGFNSGQMSESRKFSTAFTPGRLKCSEVRRSVPKRPSSACAVYGPDRKTTCKENVSSFNSSARKIKTPKSHSRRTPSKVQTPKTPKDSDRFIPPRGSMNFASSHHKIMQIVMNNENDVEGKLVGKKVENELMSENLNKVLGDSNVRVLQHQCKVLSPTKGPFSPVKQLSSASSSAKKKAPRRIPTIPERVLDAPNYVDDYYLNLLHWSSSVDLLAVALDNSVYIWTPSTGDINHLCELDEPENYVSSLQWVEQGSHLAVGTVNGTIQLWDTEHKKRLRQMSGHAARVSSLAWNAHILCSGSRSGKIHNHDVRIADHHIGSYALHSQEVCGLAWSPSGRYLASGSNNNRLIVWDYNQISQENGSCVHNFGQHKAAVKALAWCPWQHHLLASGGGSADKCIKFWNINSGHCLNTIETSSQVSSLLWSERYKEIISGHGHPNNQLSIWQYPSMTKKADLLGHTCRVLQMTMSPDKTRVMSAAGDETLRLWHCFEYTKEQRKERSKLTSHRNDIFSLSAIR